MSGTSTVKHPLYLLEQETSLPTADLSVILAQHGVGKTAVLINFGLGQLLKGRTVRHFSASMSTEKTQAYYQEIYADLTQHYFELDFKPWDHLKPNLTVVSYPNADEMIAHLEPELETISGQTQQQSDLVIVDDLDYFTSIEAHIKRIAEVAQQEKHPILAGVTVHRDHTGTVPLKEPSKQLRPHAAKLFYMEPDPLNDRVGIDLVNHGQGEPLGIYFDPHKLIFRLP